MGIKLLEIIKNQLKAENIKIEEKTINATLDSYLDDDFLEKISLIKDINKERKISTSIDSAFFFKKLLNFLYGIKDIPASDRINFFEGCEQSHDDKFIEKIIIFLQKYDDFEKCRYMSKLFNALIYKKIDFTMFVRLCITLENVYVEDIKFLILSINTEYIGGISAVTLANAGLAYECCNNSLESNNSYNISSLGYILCDNLL